MLQIAPSILSCDFARLGEEAAAIQAAGGKLLHVDVMDGHFVPNLSLGIPVVASLRKATNLFLDVHLMLTNPADYMEKFIQAGADSVTIHVESDGAHSAILSRIRQLGARAAVSLNPETPVSQVLPFLPQVDMVLVMTVHPGFGGQSFIEEMMPKLDVLCAERERLGLSFAIQVDGGINPQTAAIAAAHGAEVLVAGSAVFGKADYRQAMDGLLQAAGGK